MNTLIYSKIGSDTKPNTKEIHPSINLSYSYHRKGKKESDGTERGKPTGWLASSQTQVINTSTALQGQRPTPLPLHPSSAAYMSLSAHRSRHPLSQLLHPRSRPRPRCLFGLRARSMTLRARRPGGS